MRKTTLAALVSLLALGFVDGIVARAEDPAPAAKPKGHQFYNPDTVETLSGEVTRVAKVAHKRRRGYGVQLMLKTDKELVLVRLGPGWYVERQKVKIQPKDTIQVKGSRLTLGGKPTIVAAEVHKGEKVLRLRDDSGAPLWRKSHTT